VSPFVLSVLKYSLLVLLYFFIYRAVKSVAVGVGGRKESSGRPRDRTSKPKPASRGKVPSAVVVHLPGGKKAGSYPLTEAVSLGRGERCTIKLDDTYVSQMHARLFGRDGAWFVEDLGSTNGTYLNDRRVSAPVQVRAGDVVRVGKTVLELRR
jgi:hypothetical protein